VFLVFLLLLAVGEVDKTVLVDTKLVPTVVLVAAARDLLQGQVLETPEVTHPLKVKMVAPVAILLVVVVVAPVQSVVHQQADQIEQETAAQVLSGQALLGLFMQAVVVAVDGLVLVNLAQVETVVVAMELLAVLLLQELQTGAEAEAVVDSQDQMAVAADLVLLF
jgi:hypothetical protein